MEPNWKKTIEIGDRVLASNGSTGYVSAVNGDDITVDIRGGSVVSPRRWTFTTEIESDRPVSVHCLECGCAVTAPSWTCQACGGF